MILVTVSDDRFGRKDGKYSETQDRITKMFDGKLPVIDWKWHEIQTTRFYRDNKVLLDNIDAARNGRVYKPFVILDALNKVPEGEYIIYNDCSPELWENVNPEKYNLEFIKVLCREANDILVPFIKWSRTELKEGQLGEATHKNYTLTRCMDKMGLRFYEDAYMCASGMICIRKTEKTLSLVEEWLRWNLIDECCALGWAHIENDHTFWNEESHPEFGKEGFKMGCRHDQSILGLLLARTNHRFCDSDLKDIHGANFLQFCGNTEYRFIDCLPKLHIGDRVVNKQETQMHVFQIVDGKYAVGQSDGSQYLTARENLKLI